jgi:hypothetical protein
MPTGGCGPVVYSSALLADQSVLLVGAHGLQLRRPHLRSVSFVRTKDRTHETEDRALED